MENRYGFIFIRKGDGFRCKQHPSLAVKDDRSSFYWHSIGTGGFGVIDFLMKIENMSFCEAMESINISCFRECQPHKISQSEIPKKLILPEKAKQQSHIFNYLCGKRGIAFEIVTAFVEKEKIYEDVLGNVVFIGHDEHYIPKFASVRGTANGSQYRADCRGSDKRYGFNMTYSQSPQLYIFESAIDVMSHATIIISQNSEMWCEQNRLSLSGTSDKALQKYLELYPNITDLIFCLDNDPHGREAAVSLAGKYAEKGFYTRLELPEHKDYNDDLLFQNKLQRGWCDDKNCKQETY